MVGKIVALAEDSTPPDSKQLVGYAPLRRTDSGEYRIVYYTNATTVYVVLVGKRNDADVYKKLRRTL